MRLLESLREALTSSWRHTPSPDSRHEWAWRASPEQEWLPQCGQHSEARRHPILEDPTRTGYPASALPHSSCPQWGAASGKVGPHTTAFASPAAGGYGLHASVKPMRSCAGNSSQVHPTRHLGWLANHVQIMLTDSRQRGLQEKLIQAF